ncbi:hypothetical protein [Chitinophaga arvensicola]|uniref:Uncharacterized protein n=1 Tax=Chitinophaga arvensicola TaxID=29529 RepID=A0A1I0RA64_9BACT|nr:hypothetical protein [Chitinophaga arvensicola]SEW37513.1 hypothetical protein SAMN04488122_2515 [Chitinophaga arvensicola]
MPNTGKKHYALLVQYSTATGLPTGVVKPNNPSDPDYVAPVEDLESCPAPPQITTHFEINNLCADPILTDILFAVYTASGRTGTVVPGAHTDFTVQGDDHAIQIIAPSAGQSLSSSSEKRVVVDVFIFQNDKLMYAKTINSNYADPQNDDPVTGYNPDGWHIESLSGNILINVTGNEKGFYSSTNVLAVESAAGFGNAGFDFSIQGYHGPATASLTAASQFAYIDFVFWSDPIHVDGQNSNDYNLKLEFIASEPEWIPDDPDNWEGPGHFEQRTISSIIAPGPYSTTLDPNALGGRDFIVRISKQ